MVLQEVDESGTEVFTVLLPSGTPLPARRHHVLSGGGNLSSLCLEIYQRCVAEQPEKLAKVQKSTNTGSNVEQHTPPDFVGGATGCSKFSGILGF